jgi:hypothetical protein
MPVADKRLERNGTFRKRQRLLQRRDVGNCRGPLSSPVSRRRSRVGVENPYTFCHVGDNSQVLVGHVACLGHGGGGHTLWHCRACPDTEPPVYGPPLGKPCTVLEGPASVRISTGQDSL